MTANNNSSQKLIWIVLAVCLVLFCILKYGMWKSLSDTNRELVRANSIRAEQERIQSDAKLAIEKVGEWGSIHRKQQQSLDETFASFHRQEMADALTEQLAVPKEAGILILRKSNLNYGGSEFIYAPDQQSLVVLAKLYDAKKPRKGFGLDLLESPDQRFDIPLPVKQLVEFESDIKETKNGSELILQLANSEPVKISFDQLKPGGYSSRGWGRKPLHTNQFGIDHNTWMKVKGEKDLRVAFFEHGFWHLLHQYSFHMRDSAGVERKQLQVVIAFQSAGPFFVSSQNKYRVNDVFDLTWDSDMARYRISPKLSSN